MKQKKLTTGGNTILKYYLNSVQEAKVLHNQLTRQGMKCKHEYPKDKGYDGVVHIIVYSIGRSFSFLTETITTQPRTLCYSVTEVLKRTWNTWFDNGLDEYCLLKENDIRIFYPKLSITFSKDKHYNPVPFAPSGTSIQKEITSVDLDLMSMPELKCNNAKSGLAILDNRRILMAKF